MRVKKQKRHRKSVRFYTSCFGFREPFKVLCDGTFISHLVLNNPNTPHTHYQSLLANLLGAPTKLFTTRCILAELKSLGDSYSESFRAARNLFTARCDHERRKSAAGCIEDIIKENNSEHFFLATQDVDLRNKFQEIPGVPLIYGLRNSLFLAPPSHFQRQFVKSTEEARLHMSELEYKMLSKREKKNTPSIQLASDSPGADEVLMNEGVKEHAVTNIDNTRRMLGVAEKSKFKRKKAKVRYSDYHFA
ncbi:PIN domain-like family protein [Tasmannia lanceolata]|uniref:PIN domain-like family protein n=1 Tax=Tasmannia lanceolata TaxID=3420 RepID=UPI00406497B7